MKKWVKPILQTVKEKELKKIITVNARSGGSGCNVGFGRMVCDRFII